MPCLATDALSSNQLSFALSSREGPKLHKICYQRPVAGFIGSGLVLYIIVLETSVPRTTRFHSRTVANILATLVVSLMILIDFCTRYIRTHDILTMLYSVNSLVLCLRL